MLGGWIFLFLGGPVWGALCGAAGLLMIVGLMFLWGPFLWLVAGPVLVGILFIFSAQEYFTMFVNHMTIYLVIFMIAAFVISLICTRKFNYNKVMAACAAFTLIVMLGLAIWMYMPREFPVPEDVARIEIQRVEESGQAVYTDPDDFTQVLQQLERVEMRGSFKELVEFEEERTAYRLTFRREDGKDLGTYYFINEDFMLVEWGNTFLYYEATDSWDFPTPKLIDMLEYAKGLG